MVVLVDFSNNKSMLFFSTGAGTILEFEAKLQMTDDKDFYHLHDNIIKKNNAKFSPVPGNGPNSCVKLSLRLLHTGIFFQTRFLKLKMYI
jgi:hypothetical protein